MAEELEEGQRREAQVVFLVRSSHLETGFFSLSLSLLFTLRPKRLSV